MACRQRDLMARVSARAQLLLGGDYVRTRDQQIGGKSRGEWNEIHLALEGQCVGQRARDGRAVERRERVVALRLRQAQSGGLRLAIVER